MLPEAHEVKLSKTSKTLIIEAKNLFNKTPPFIIVTIITQSFKINQYII